MRRKPRGIKVFMERRCGHVETDKGPCQLGDNEEGKVRYFIAAKPPRYAILCDKDYMMIRERLEKTLAKIWEELGL